MKKKLLLALMIIGSLMTVHSAQSATVVISTINTLSLEEKIQIRLRWFGNVNLIDQLLDESNNLTQGAVQLRVQGTLIAEIDGPSNLITTYLKHKKFSLSIEEFMKLITDSEVTKAMQARLNEPKEKTAIQE